MNVKFLREVEHRSRPMAVDSLDDAIRVLAKNIAANPGAPTAEELGRATHLAWVLGLDGFFADRHRLRELVSFMVPDQPAPN